MRAQTASSAVYTRAMNAGGPSPLVQTQSHQSIASHHSMQSHPSHLSGYAHTSALSGASLVTSRPGTLPAPPPHVNGHAAPAPPANGAPVMASDSIINQVADSSKSLYQICVKLRQRLSEVPGFQQHLEEMEEDDSVSVDEPVDPVESMWRCLRKGYPLMTVYNALNPPARLEVDPTKVAEAKRAKTASFKFVQACLRDLNFPPDECFLIMDLYGDDTTGFVKVTTVVNRVLDILQQRNLLMRPEVRDPTTAIEQTQKRTRRDYVVSELVNTERKYVQDLETLQQFKKLVEEKGEVAGDTIHAIFLNLNALLDFQRRFLIRIETMNSLPDEQQNWGQLFTQYHDAFRVYEPYIANQQNAEEQAMREFDKLQKVGHRITNDRATLSGFLLKPFQRLSKYPLLLKVLAEATTAGTAAPLARPLTHEQELRDKCNSEEHLREDISSGIESAAAVLKQANAAIDKQQRQLAVDELRTRVEEWKGHDIQQFGELLLYGTFTVVKGDGRNDVEREVRNPSSQRTFFRARGRLVSWPFSRASSSSSSSPTTSTSEALPQEMSDPFVVRPAPGDPPLPERQGSVPGSSASLEPTCPVFASSSSASPCPSPTSPDTPDLMLSPTEEGFPSVGPDAPIPTESYEGEPRSPEDPYLSHQLTLQQILAQGPPSEPCGSPLVSPGEHAAVTLGTGISPSDSSCTITPSTAGLTRAPDAESTVDPAPSLESQPAKARARSAPTTPSWRRKFSWTFGPAEDEEEKLQPLQDGTVLVEKRAADNPGLDPLEKTYANEIGAIAPRCYQYKIFLFERILLCCKEQNPNRQKNKVMSMNKPAQDKKGKPKLQLKGRIFMQNVTETLSLQKPGSYTIQIFWKGDPGVENFVIRFTNEETMKKWYDRVEEQRKFYTDASKASGTRIGGGTSDTEFAWVKNQAIPNPYQQDDGDDDDEEDLLPETGYHGGSANGIAAANATANPNSEFNMSRNASNTSLRSRSTTGDSGGSVLTNGTRAPPPRFPMGFTPPPALTLHTQMSSNMPSPGEQGGASYFSPAAESPVSSRTSSSNAMYPFPRQATPNGHNGWPEEHNRFTAPAMGRTAMRPSLPAMASQSATTAPVTLTQQRSRSASSPDIHNRIISGHRMPNGQAQPPVPDVPMPPLPAHIAYMKGPVSRSPNHSPTNLPSGQALPNRSSNHSPGMPRDRSLQHRYTQPHGHEHERHDAPRAFLQSRNTTPIPASSMDSRPPTSSGPMAPLALPHDHLAAPTQLKVKVSFDNNYVTLVVGMNISYQSLVDRIDAKLSRFTTLSIGRGTIRLRYQDEDGDFVTIRSDEDIHIAFTDWKEQQRSQLMQGQLGEIQLYCQGLET
ncbi:MAG: hypothetical protein M1838_002321 [Thelocarpon superellum]|nr:MAG: hypothetical protein M1838_002321 [Thelocarpon superellum]